MVPPERRNHSVKDVHVGKMYDNVIVHKENTSLDNIRNILNILV